MKAHHLGILIVAAVLAIVAALWTSEIREPPGGNGMAGERLLPGLEDHLNELTGLQITGPGSAAIATLSRADGVWSLAEKGGYRANLAELRGLLLQLAQAELLEEKTSNPEYYDRLGVQDPDADDATGFLLRVEGFDAPAVIIGDQAGSRRGVYARRVGEATSWLVSGDIVVADDTADWLQREVFDISGSRIAEVEIRHADGAIVNLAKSAFGQPNFDVVDKPSDRELQREDIANTIGGVLQNLRFDEVLPAAGNDIDAAAATQTTFRAFDGLVIDAVAAARDDKYVVRFSASADAATAGKYLPAPVAVEGEELPPRSVSDIGAITAEAEALNRKMAGWVYEIPKSKYDQLSRRMEDLLKDEP